MTHSFIECPLHRSEKNSIPRDDCQQAICNLCRLFYSKGWINATGGAISIRDENKIYFGPVGVENKGQCPLELFVLDLEGQIKEIPEKITGLAESKSLMVLLHTLKNAGAVIHTHSMNSMLITWLYSGEIRLSESELENILRRKIENASLQDHIIPIVENSPEEKKLFQSLSGAITGNPNARAALVRGHGIYIWGRDWMEAKQYLELYEWLFEMLIQSKQKTLKQ